jgi:type I restriction enzyme, S subunit
MSWKKVKLGDILKQYRIEHRVDDKTTYKQVSILNDGSVVLRGEKIGKEIGRKRQFIIDTKKYPNTLIFTRQLLLQGSIGIASDDVNNCIVTENMPMFSIDTTKIDKEFLILFLKSKVFKARIGEIELSGSAQKSIHEKTFLSLEFVLPPFELQKTKVVELLKLKSNSDNITTELTHQINLVKKLRQQLLQDAVQGKLVDQNKKDEPASELLKKIKAEKEKLIAEKKIKQGKIQEAEKQEELIFEIPKNWTWCTLDEISKNITDGTHQTPTYTKSGRIFLSAQNIKPFKFMPEEHKFVSEEAYDDIIKNRKPEKGDILIARVGAGIGEAAVINQDIDFCFYVSLGLVQPFKDFLNTDYLTLVINSPYGVKYAKGNISSKGGSAGNFNLGRIRSFLIPLPPLVEQERIVQKVEELMQYCNELEESIKQSQSQNEKLLQQVLREALRKEPVDV